jgi:hypothetical protein
MASITEIVYAPLSANATWGNPVSTTIKCQRPERRPNERVFAHITLARYIIGAPEYRGDPWSGEIRGATSTAQVFIREYCFYDTSSNRLKCVTLPDPDHDSKASFSCSEIGQFVSVTFELRVVHGMALANAVVMCYS